MGEKKGDGVHCENTQADVQSGLGGRANRERNYSGKRLV